MRSETVYVLCTYIYGLLELVDDKHTFRMQKNCHLFSQDEIDFTSTTQSIREHAVGSRSETRPR